MRDSLGSDWLLGSIWRYDGEKIDYRPSFLVVVEVNSSDSIVLQDALGNLSTQTLVALFTGFKSVPDDYKPGLELGDPYRRARQLAAEVRSAV